MNNSSSNILKMIFIYNALNDGWIVKKIKTNQFEFTKNIENNNYLKKISLEESFLNNFIKQNFKIKNLK